MKLYMLSSESMAQAKRMLWGGVRPPRIRGPMQLRVNEQYMSAYSFWKGFFDEHCQIPSEGTRLFQVNLPMRSIYEWYFKHWWIVVKAKDGLDVSSLAGPQPTTDRPSAWPAAIRCAIDRIPHAC